MHKIVRLLFADLLTVFQLAELGGEQFVAAEGAALLQFETKHSVVSLSGSNPMHEASMKHIQSLGTIVFIDVPTVDILERLDQMKVCSKCEPFSDYLISNIVF